ncbi:MAG: hypothetical protein J6S36_03660 [Eggerthellaceae bacterium]|nr:hypothetical protein [Eggerthellaceae bacterium]
MLISPIVSALVAIFGAYAAVKRQADERERKYAESIARLETKLDMLSDRVDKHNNIVERTYKLESDVEHLQSDVQGFKIGGTE